MTVRELIEALAEMPCDAPVVIEGTSVQVYPCRVVDVTDLRKRSSDIWPFEDEPEDSVFILTDKVRDEVDGIK